MHDFGHSDRPRLENSFQADSQAYCIHHHSRFDSFHQVVPRFGQDVPKLGLDASLRWGYNQQEHLGNGDHVARIRHLMVLLASFSRTQEPGKVAFSDRLLRAVVNGGMGVVESRVRPVVGLLSAGQQHIDSDPGFKMVSKADGDPSYGGGGDRSRRLCFVP